MVHYAPRKAARATIDASSFERQGGPASAARWRASSCRPKLGGALKTSHPPPRPRASTAPCWPIRRRSWSREPVPVLRRAHARSVRAARARLRQQRPALRSTRLDKTRKRDVQTGGGEAPSRGARRWHFFLGGGFPVINWGSISTLNTALQLKLHATVHFFTPAGSFTGVGLRICASRGKDIKEHARLSLTLAKRQGSGRGPPTQRTPHQPCIRHRM